MPAIRLSKPAPLVRAGGASSPAFIAVLGLSPSC